MDDDSLFLEKLTSNEMQRLPPKRKCAFKIVRLTDSEFEFQKSPQTALYRRKPDQTLWALPENVLNSTNSTAKSFEPATVEDNGTSVRYHGFIFSNYLLSGTHTAKLRDWISSDDQQRLSEMLRNMLHSKADRSKFGEFLQHADSDGVGNGGTLKISFFRNRHSVLITIHVVNRTLDKLLEVDMRIDAPRIEADFIFNALTDAENREAMQGNTEKANKMEHEFNSRLLPLGLTVQGLLDRSDIMTEEAAEIVMAVLESTPPNELDDLDYALLGQKKAAKPVKEKIGRWLIAQFELQRNMRWRWRMSDLMWDVATLAIAPDLIRLVKERKYGEGREMLCFALAASKHPAAAETLASVLDDPSIRMHALDRLGCLKGKAAPYEAQIRACLETEHKKEAIKALRRMGVAEFQIAPAPAKHLQKRCRKPPKTLANTSENLDGCELRPRLEWMATHVDSGVAEPEITEVLNIVDEMKVDQTRQWIFPIVLNGGESSELWLTVFLDDEDSPDVDFDGPKFLIDAFEKQFHTD